MYPRAAAPPPVKDNDVQWPIAGLLLDALARRDFAAMRACMHPSVRFRALLPGGVRELAGAAATADQFQKWFGGDDDFEVVDASIGQLGVRIYIRWRIRLTATDDRGSSRQAEQHVFADATEQIDAIDLMCSGFQPVT